MKKKIVVKGEKGPILALFYEILTEESGNKRCRDFFERESRMPKRSCRDGKPYKGTIEFVN